LDADNEDRLIVLFGLLLNFSVHEICVPEGIQMNLETILKTLQLYGSFSKMSGFVSWIAGKHEISVQSRLCCRLLATLLIIHRVEDRWNVNMPNYSYQQKQQLLIELTELVNKDKTFSNFRRPVIDAVQVLADSTPLIPLTGDALCSVATRVCRCIINSPLLN